MYKPLGERAKAKHLEAINNYLADDTCYDLLKYARNNDVGIYFTMNDWLTFAGEVLSEDDLNKFKEKLFPLEAKEDGSNEQEMKELRAKIVNLANGVMKREVTLFDIIDEVGTNLKKYIYMVKQCAYKYNAINRSTLASNFEFCQKVWSYQKPIEQLTISFPDLDNKQVSLVKGVIEDRGLILNDITYRQAYYYALNKGIITKKNTSSR